MLGTNCTERVVSRETRPEGSRGVNSAGRARVARAHGRLLLFFLRSIHGGVLAARFLRHFVICYDFRLILTSDVLVGEQARAWH